MEVIVTKLSGLFLIKPKRFGDHRGFFAETYSFRSYKNHGIDTEFLQDNHSLSVHINTLRGLHFQKPPNSQAKLVRCGKGSIFDVAVDLRKGSSTFGQWFGEIMSEKNGIQMLIPEGFAHGFLTLVPNSEIVYKCSDYYAPESEGAVRWNDPDIGIEWPSNATPVISDKDQNAPFLKEIISPFK